MSNENGIITAPVSIADVKAVLGESSNDLGTLCKSSNINMWAKYKPINGGELFYTDFSSDGITYPSQETLTDFLQTCNTQHEQLNWKFNNVVGAPYRLGDFDKYNHYAVLPMWVPNKEYYLDFNDNDGLVVSIETPSNLPQYNLTPSDLSVKDWYLMAVVYDYDGKSIVGSFISEVPIGKTMGRSMTIPREKLLKLNVGKNDTNFANLFCLLVDSNKNPAHFAAISAEEKKFDLTLYPLEITVTSSASAISILSSISLGSLNTSSVSGLTFYESTKFVNSSYKPVGYFRVNAKTGYNQSLVVKCEVNNSSSSPMVLNPSNLSYEIIGGVNQTNQEMYVVDGGTVARVGETSLNSTSYTVPANTKKTLAFVIAYPFNFGETDEWEGYIPANGIYVCKGIYIKNNQTYIAVMTDFCFKQDSTYQGNGEFVTI